MLHRDGFVSLVAGGAEGSVLTEPSVAPERDLHLNADALEGRRARRCAICRLGRSSATLERGERVLLRLSVELGLVSSSLGYTHVRNHRGMRDPNSKNYWGPMRPLGEALRFLTCIPVAGLPAPDEQSMARGFAAFPTAGLIIGVLGVAAGAIAQIIWGPLLASLFVVSTWAFVSLGLHLDGVADTCDGMFSGHPPERKLEIMRDSRIGALGAVGLILVLAFKVVGIFSLGPWWWLGAAIAPVWGRWSAVYGIFWFPAARGEGRDKNLHKLIRGRDFLMATISALAMSAFFVFPHGVLVLLLVASVTHLLGHLFRRSLGGLTGDTCGAMSEVAEIVTLLGLVAASRLWSGWPATVWPARLLELAL